MNKKVILTIGIVLVTCLLCVLAVFLVMRGSTKSVDVESETEDEIMVMRDPEEIVDMFLKYTLGTIPGDEVNYEAAKQLLLPEFAEEFTDDSFVPFIYCIQDGPEDVRIAVSDFWSTDETKVVEVEGAYNDEWLLMWYFVVETIAEDNWRISNIDCE